MCHGWVACHSGNAFCYSTSGPVSTWMGDSLQADKSSQYLTNQPGQLSLLSSIVWWNEYHTGLVRKSAATQRLCYSFQMDRVHSCTGCAMMTAS